MAHLWYHFPRSNELPPVISLSLLLLCFTSHKIDSLLHTTVRGMVVWLIVTFFTSSLALAWSFWSDRSVLASLLNPVLEEAETIARGRIRTCLLLVPRTEMFCLALLPLDRETMIYGKYILCDFSLCCCCCFPAPCFFIRPPRVVVPVVVGRCCCCEPTNQSPPHVTIILFSWFFCAYERPTTTTYSPSLQSILGQSQCRGTCFCSRLTRRLT